MDYKSSIDLLKELIAIPSFSKEEKARADFLCRYLRELGFEPNESATIFGVRQKT